MCICLLLSPVVLILYHSPSRLAGGALLAGNATASGQSETSSCALKVELCDVSFKKAGRYFLTLASSEVERRTSVSSSGSSHFASKNDRVIAFVGRR